MHPHSSTLWKGFAAALFLVTAACGHEERTGSAQLFGSLSQAVSSSTVTRVVVTLSAADMTTRTETLSKTSGSWGGTLGGIPAGTARTFVAEGFDASGVLQFKGQASGITITAGQTTVVAITLQELNPKPPFENAVPLIDSLTAAASTVAPGGTLNLEATAHDPNASDTLTYLWTASAGAFYSPYTLATTWAAPTTPGPVTLTLTVKDSKGASAALSLTLQVQAASGSATVNILFNASPEVSRITASPSRVDVGEPLSAVATATDSDGDALSYQWTASCAGSWTAATSATASFTPSAQPSSSTCDNCSLTVTVTDGRGGQTTGTLHVCVGKVAARFPPRIESTYQSTQTVPASGNALFRVTASDAQNSALTFSWSTTTGTLGTPRNGTTQSEVSWTPPSCVPQATMPSLTATVTNALGLSTSTTFSLTGGTPCVTSGWAPTGSMSETRFGHRAVLLPSGKVLVMGGNSSTVLATAQLYDPATASWSPTGAMTASRDNFAVAMLPSGKVLVTGGRSSIGPQGIANAELYDPATGTWAPTTSMTFRRYHHAAVPLPSGKVLFMGGLSPEGQDLASAEVFDPSTSSWSPTGAMVTGRYEHTATLLASGKVLVTGGWVNGSPSATAEVYDPATGTWSATGNMASPRTWHKALLLASGKVLVMGGNTSNGYLASAEVYDPATGTWTATGSMSAQRILYDAVVLSSSKVLVVAGFGITGRLASTELYDPAAGTWASAGTLTAPRDLHTATVLASGQVLVAGGFNNITRQLASAELYTP